MTAYPCGQQTGAVCEREQFSGLEAGGDGSHAVVHGDGMPSEHMPRGRQETVGDGVALEVIHYKQAAGQRGKLTQQGDDIEIAEVMQQEAAGYDVERLLAKRKAEGVGGGFGRWSGAQVAEVGVAGNDAGQRKLPFERRGKVSGGGADVEHGKRIGARIAACDFPLHDRVASQPAVDPAKVTQVFIRIRV